MRVESFIRLNVHVKKISPAEIRGLPLNCTRANFIWFRKTGYSIGVLSDALCIAKCTVLS